MKRIEPALQERFRRRLLQLSSTHPSLHTLTPSGRMILLSEAFEYLERQPKFIGNACRYFDSLGYDWWLPMWDTEFVNACEKLPIDLRRDKSLLKTLTHRFEQQYPAIAGPPPDFVANGGFIRDERLRALTGYFLEPFGQFAVVPFSDWFARVFGQAAAGGTVIEIVSQRCLRSITAMLPRAAD